MGSFGQPSRGRVCVVGFVLALVLAPAVAGCLLSDETVTGTGQGSGTSSGGRDVTPGPPQCKVDADCGAFDTDQDPCTNAVCLGGRCSQKLIRNESDCQCHADKDCAHYEKGCALGVCNDHKCAEKLRAAGPAPKQKAGDCETIRCDGVSSAPIEEADPTDVPNDDNPCTVDVCEATGPKQTRLANGTACGSGICFDGRCLTCVPQDPTSCGSEGPGEPANDASATASTFREHAPFCAYSSGTDTDWYTFNAVDGDFSYDVLNFHFWSTAPTIELCAYVRCGNGGTPGGGCSPLLPGPNGSQGCCWTGSPSTLAPSWDLDCPGTTEDEGPVYLSVRTPGGDACEVYAMSGGY
jgi:hypothetical protein